MLINIWKFVADLIDIFCLLTKKTPSKIYDYKYKKVRSIMKKKR